MEEFCSIGWCEVWIMRDFFSEMGVRLGMSGGEMRSCVMMLMVEVIVWICFDERCLWGGRVNGVVCF